MLEMAKLPFLGKGSFNEDRLRLFSATVVAGFEFSFWKEKTKCSPKEKHIRKGKRKEEQCQKTASEAESWQDLHVGEGAWQHQASSTTEKPLKAMLLVAFWSQADRNTAT